MTPLKDLLGMEHLAFSEIKPKVLKALSPEKLEILQHHIRYFDLQTKNQIWRMVGIPSHSTKSTYSLVVYSFLVTFQVWFINNS